MAKTEAMIVGGTVCEIEIQKGVGAGSGRALFLNFAGDPTGFSRAPILLFVSLNALISVQEHSGDLNAKGRGINRL
ncbi:hypothetical protein SDJN03_11989, partial [Cucurbita argyrosperma subsp. sororia]